MIANPLRSVTAQLSRISIGLPRASIRLKSTKKRHTKPPPKWEPGHGEKFYIFSHRGNGLTVYSHSPIIRANRALKQIPFNGKKLKPAKIRKDYWRRLAMIQFPEGLGHVGRSVFHIMREFRMQHELNWGDEVLYDEEHHIRTKHQRGEALNNQKANAIADLAAVLAGAGKGNKMWMDVSEGGDNVETDIVETEPAETDAAETDAAETDAVETDAVKTEAVTSMEKGLVKATVFWENEQDRNFAEQWTGNVTHALFADSHLVPLEGLDPVAPGDSEAGAAESENIPPELIAEEQVSKTPDQPKL